MAAATACAASRVGDRFAADSPVAESPSAWKQALQVRRQFEAEPARRHTHQAYEHVMNQFRVIYRGDPGGEHAAAAVEAVAELFAQRGRELHDPRSMAAAVQQYEYLAKAYPADRLAPVALQRALQLLGSQSESGADTQAEASKIRAELAEDYPQAKQSARVAQDAPPTKAKSAAAEARPASNNSKENWPKKISDASATPPGPTITGASSSQSPETETLAGTSSIQKQRTSAAASGPLDVVTGIRHWSTASYTRVAIDLNVAPGEVVKYRAARVEHPDRIFFDLEHAQLSGALVGKSITVTDNGFLKKVRAAQFNNNVTRVVLDVHHVTAYSAFCLPNPYRLIIDIHGDPTSRQASQTPNPPIEPKTNSSATQVDAALPSQSPAESTPPTETTHNRIEISRLPPMPVTDGRASFALPQQSQDAVSYSSTQGRPSVITAQNHSLARPAPAPVAASSMESDAEVADVSRQPGIVEATRQPTSMPIAETSRDLGLEPRRATRLKPSSAAAAQGAEPAVAEVKAEPAPAPPPTSSGETSLMRALGLKIDRIVIDAGHGGHDSGTLGAGGIEEKDVVLDVALRLGKLLHQRLGADVVYTRDNDTFIPLETRTAIANKAQADLFISVHANSSRDPSVSGVEVYYLNFTSDPEAMRVAARENAVSTQSVHELSDLVKKIALQDKIDESQELAVDVDASLYAGQRKGNPRLRNRGVKKAPFVVLIGANMPSILAEIGFVTNPRSAAELETPQYRERVAESLYRGIARYSEGVNGLRPSTEPVKQAER
ncbi:MAG: N-acetylmuramoyl-L-alanine amidase [Acidobacteriaceae bacterium]